MKQVQSSWFHGSMQSLPSTIPSLIEQVISDQEDKSSTQTCKHNRFYIGT